MAETRSDKPIVIKKYANRRLYNTGTSSYVTLDDLAAMVKKGCEFVVQDAKTGEDITRSVLTQIIVEEEAKGGQTLLPISFLRQLIAFYGHGLQALVPQYLEASMAAFAAQQDKWRDMLTGKALPGAEAFGSFDELARKNMAMFEQAARLFSGGWTSSARSAPREDKATPPTSSDIEQLRAQLAALKDQLDKLSK
ncbi:MAG: polyhydroxyalkanoate synthesis repressor PhaR [Pseudomonadota bacterium]